MKVITAPNKYEVQDNEISLFLAGGITNCPDWQSEIIDRLEYELNDNNLVIFNPRRKNFPIHKPSAAYEQIEWEFNNLNRMDIFSMYFCNGESDQPICLYELGRYIAKMQMRFPIDWKDRIIVSVEKGYNRTQDVIIQTQLACGKKFNVNTSQVNTDILMDYHIDAICKAYNKLKRTF